MLSRCAPYTVFWYCLLWLEVCIWCMFVFMSVIDCGWESEHPAFGPPASLSLHLASSSITPAGSVHKSSGDSVVRMWVQLKRWWVLLRGHSPLNSYLFVHWILDFKILYYSGDECDLASTLCKYDLRKGDLFVLSWTWVRQGSISSELLMCGGGVRSILLLPLVSRCLEMYVYRTCLFIWLL